ncbi:hypothetical protein GT037_001811 [Alternaria burnsii]|uniref:Uncharacterized protein n=1 Tax=Alternaria burnsii TaxID=1187904 RepID=A0A8H7EHH4_9PLEO|nr:uncharacterized protein GT037_001811 [Alternaria burnsii]KAF7680160.1 hypothetical protein GT037_001811 [Alternaria burnsii]CAI9628827.1 unnamed protein product [Alternaria burnsii]
MAIKVSSWFKGHFGPSSDTDITDEDEISGLDESMDLEHANAEEKMYKKKYCQVRKQVDEDEICNNIRADNASLRNDKKELENKLIRIENAKLSAEVQLMRREKELNDVKANNSIERGASNERNKRLKLDNRVLRNNEEHMKFLLLSHDIRTPTLPITSRATPPTTPGLTDDDSDMDDADDLSVCPEWYNRRNCSRGVGTRSKKCERGAHPHFINFRTPLRAAF